jgi:HNH endonuclease
MNRYIRHGVCTPEEVLPLVKEHYGSSLPRPTFHGFKVGVSSLRMKTFQHDGLTCRGCGLVASFFAVEDFHTAWAASAGAAKASQPHLNLYGINDKGEEVLFTHDHVLARALGGADNLNNVQTMCSPCNNKKGRAENPQKKLKKALTPEQVAAKAARKLAKEFQFQNFNPDSKSGIAILDENPTYDSCVKTE